MFKKNILLHSTLYILPAANNCLNTEAKAHNMLNLHLNYTALGRMHASPCHVINGKYQMC